MTSYTTVSIHEEGKMNNFFLSLFFLLILGLASSIYCQSYFVEAYQFPDESLKNAVLSIRLSGQVIASDEEKNFLTQTNYKLYGLIDPDGITIHADPLNTKVKSVEFEQKNQEIKLTFDTPLEFTESPDAKKIYLLKINNTTWGGKEVPVIRFELVKKAVIATTTNPRDGLKVQSNVALSINGFSVNKTILSISKDNQNLLIDTKEIPVKPCLKADECKERKNGLDQLDIIFKKKLAEATNHYLTVNVQTISGQKLTGQKTISVPGLPEPVSNPDIDINLSSEFGTGKAPQFNLVSSFKRLFYEKSSFLIEPKLSVDVGLGNTSSKNAITLELPTLRHRFFIREPKGDCEKKIPPTLRRKPEINEIKPSSTITEGKSTIVPLSLGCYAGWRSRNPLSLYSIDLNVGPKFEINEKFTKINALGTARLDFNFDRWQNSIARQRSYLKADLAKFEDYKENYKDVLINYGFSITPRIGIEAGKKLSGDLFENDSKSIHFVIAPYPILRSYAGFESVFEINRFHLPITFSISQDFYYFAKPETVGEIKDNVLILSKIRGFQPHGKATLDIGIGPSKRYSFTTTYENGRSAPNFKYLNTVKSGIRIVY